MLPLEDRPPAQPPITPFVTYAIIALNALVFLYELTLSPSALSQFVRAWGATPYEISHAVDITPVVSVPVYASLLTSLFIHGGFLHIIGNMVFLWVFGDNVERHFGHLRFLLFYLLAGVVAALAQTAVISMSRDPMIGASGAVAGVLGAYLLLFPRARVQTLFFVGPFLAVGRVGAFILIAVWFATQLFQGVGSLVNANSDGGGVAFFAHIGGFIFGLIATAAEHLSRHERFESIRQGLFLGWAARNWVITIAALLIGLWLASLLSASSPALAGLLQAAILLSAVGVAIVDALRRLTGHHSFLGQGAGLGRVLALIQLLLALILLLGLLGLGL